MTQDGWTPLMIASSKNFPEIVQELLKAGANPDIKNMVRKKINFYLLYNRAVTLM